MIDSVLRRIANLLLYGGLFIGLCAACITALSFELTGQENENLHYTFLIGAATSALYSIHRIIGLHKTAHLITTDRFAIIRKYQFHIRVYAVLWVLLSIWLMMPLLSLRFIFWMLPGGLIGFAYVIPFLSGGRRLRDLGWGKILLISWSWSWLTAVVPLGYFTNASPQMIIIHGLERLLFIMLIAIPFEIRDIKIDRSLGLVTMPEKLGVRRTLKIGWLIAGCTVLLSFIASFHYFNTAYGLAIGSACLMMIPMLKFSYNTGDDYFFSGWMDGVMIMALWFFILYKPLAGNWI